MHAVCIPLQIYDTFAHGAALVFVMEAMERSLADDIAAQSFAFPSGVIKGYMLQILQGLCHLHSIGEAHTPLRNSGTILLSGLAVGSGLEGCVRANALMFRWHDAVQALSTET